MTEQTLHGLDFGLDHIGWMREILALLPPPAARTLGRIIVFARNSVSFHRMRKSSGEGFSLKGEISGAAAGEPFHRI
ncbi:hypothetical protein [Thauera linaloolentis]|uniref:hypothetical protein n=1 Tax=Thauera linaloolentis TaxID=76112 RepID=UPI0012FA65C1|nr:hypothetical protein [Thauera linaloolentis]MCM8567745.1 hypothetical protein [Thauera linaloolentis]